MSGAPNAQLVDGSIDTFTGFGTLEDLVPGTNSTVAVLQADLDAGRVWRVSAPDGAGMYVQTGQAAELTANTGRFTYCAAGRTVILPARLGEHIKVSATQVGDATALAGAVYGGASASSAQIGEIGIGYTAAMTPVQKSSGNVANAIATATLAAVAGKTNYCTGFEITAGGATAASAVTAALTGLLGGTMNYGYGAPLGAGVPGVPLCVTFDPPLPASAVNTAVSISLPALGAGNAIASVNIHGYVK